MTKDLRKYLDKFGMICRLQIDGSLDGGDTLANESTRYFFSPHFHYPENLKMLEPAPGTFIRHPDITKWYSEPNRLSRDQIRSYLTACTMKGERDGPRRFSRNHRQRFYLFMPNTKRNGATKENHGQVYKYRNGRPIKRNYNWKPGDFTGPEFWAILIRSTWNRNLIWALPILDLSTLATAMFHKLSPPSNDIRNRLQIIISANERHPTWASRLAKSLYSREFFAKRVIEFWQKDPYEPPMDSFIIPQLKKYFP